MNSEIYNRLYDDLDIVAGVERGRGQRQYDWHVTAWRLEHGITLGSIPPIPYREKENDNVNV